MPGTVLLLAASPVGKGRLVDAASVLQVLAAVEPSVLSGADTANVVELADPLEPQAVLTRLRAAATAAGPLTVFVAGQLQLDRKQRLPHLALARTTPATVRYTGFPWAWVREELRLRAPGTTTLLLDLHTDAETWQWLRARPLDSGRTNAVYGRIAPPPARRVVAVPSYMKAVATILRSGWRPPVEQLHQQAVERLGAEGYADVLLASPGFVGSPPFPGLRPRPPSALKGPRPQTPDGLNNPGRSLNSPGRPQDADPHGAITAAVQAGRHPDADALAAEHEQAAVRAHGRGSEEALHWTEVRADLAMLAGIRCGVVRRGLRWRGRGSRWGRRLGPLLSRPPWTGRTISGGRSMIPFRPVNSGSRWPSCGGWYRGGGRVLWIMCGGSWGSWSRSRSPREDS